MKPKTELVIRLREEGKTYKEISEETGLSKGNISYICNRYVSDNSLIHASNHKYSITNQRLRVMRAAADLHYDNLRTSATEKWKSRLSNVPKEMLYYISGLYDGEGNHKGTEFSISNSNFGIIERLLQFFRVIGAEVGLCLYLHATHDQEECLRQWAWTGVETVYQQDDREQSRDYSITENYGTIRIRVVKPLGLRDALFELTPI